MYDGGDLVERREYSAEKLLVSLRKFRDVHISARELLEKLEANVKHVY